MTTPSYDWVQMSIAAKDESGRRVFALYAGLAAFQAGKSEADCPFTDGLRRDGWLSGFRAAAKAKTAPSHDPRAVRARHRDFYRGTHASHSVKEDA